MRPFAQRLVGVSLALGVCGCGTPPEPVEDRPPGETEAPSLSSVAGLSDAPALQALVEAQIRRDARPLLEGLRSTDEGVVARAALALASVQASEAVPGLRARVADDRGSVAELVTFALSRTGGPDEAGVLLQALASEGDAPRRLHLIRGAGFLASSAQLDDLLQAADGPEERAAAAMAISRTGTRELLSTAQVQWLVDRLTDPDPAVREGAAYFFARAREAGNWRERAIEVRSALDAMAPTDAAAAFLISALGTLEDVADTPRFVRWTRASPDWRIRAVAVQALGDRLGDDDAREAALLALDDPSPHVMEAAAAELAESRPALQAEQDRIVDWVEDHGDRWQPVALLLSGLAPLGEGARIEGWLGSLPADQVLARAAAVEALSRVPGRSHLDRLFAEARGDDPPVVAAAYRGLAAHFGNQRDDPALVERFEEAFQEGLAASHPTVVGTAARGLTDPLLLERGSGRVLEGALLARNPTDPADAAATAALVSALAQTRDQAWVPLLRRYLAHPQAGVRAAAAEGIHDLTLEPAPPTAAPGEDEAEALRMDWARFPAERPVVRMETTRGNVRMVLAADEAPLTVQTMLRLMDVGAYDGVPFHRVVPNFVVQGGDVGRRDGTGGPGYEIRTELTRIPFRRGVLGMASAGRDTEGSQFFIMHASAPHLDGRYTAFGWVTEGMEVVDALLRGDVIVRMVRES